MGIHNHSHSSKAGYWGPPTSSIDWCEDNYVWSYYIAEFFNSFSSFAMIILGEAACYSINRLQSDMQCISATASSSSTSTTTTSRKAKAPPSLFRFKLAFRTITVVGIGSFLFHATLLHHMQMLDELPMLYSVLVLFFCLIESRFGPQPAWFPKLLGVVGVVVTGLVAFTEGSVQFYSFHGTFGPLEFTTLFLIFKVYRARKAAYPDIKWVFEAGIGLYVVAVVVWMTDLNFCERTLFSFSLPNDHDQLQKDEDSVMWIVKDLYFHAWWHILVSMGLFLLSTVIMLDGLIVQGWKPVIEMRGWGWLPTVSVLEKTSRGPSSSTTSTTHATTSNSKED
ncbi:Alkaline ceramidase 3 [Linnemannia schmuckeri]|uniref:Alkaline ceramidase 3 n=1 Tax=Linnemannia schmuckeri TaxID=64567 RepID=A0A9P5VAH2_9FUNG|nr:Alkaline ceramidase 3 [Linnemannia schmuckeri]